MQKPVTVAIVGLGGRGKDTYAPMAHARPDLMKIVAIADIVPEKVDEVASLYGVARERCFASAEELLAQPRLADVLLICTQDRQHVGHAIPALQKGYHLLLEKPISPLLCECQRVLEEARRAKRQVVVCHVLRYTPFFQKLKSILDAGRIGEVRSVDRERAVLASGAQLRARQLAPRRGYQPHDSAKELSRHGYPPLAAGRPLRARLLLRFVAPFPARYGAGGRVRALPGLQSARGLPLRCL